MRLVIARCSVHYTGRLATHLPSAVRLLMVKADGSVLVHADGGGYKPLNWMAAPCTLVIEEDVWRVANRAGETMTITVEEVLHDSSHRLGLDPGLVKDGVEKQLQALLAERCQAIRPGLVLVKREYPTDIGPVDLLCRDEGGGYVAVEVKRRGEIDGVDQLTRYLERLQLGMEGIRGVFAALSFAPQAKVLAAARGIDCVQVDFDALRGIESDTLRLF